MLTINKLIAQGRGLAGVLLKRAATVELDWDVRSRSRFDATDSAGRTLGVFLPRGTVVRGGDVLVAEDGTLVRAIAAPQPVLVIRPCATHGTPFDLTRAAYHLGNRHVGIELQPDHLKIEPDPVLADMLRSMHLIVTEAAAAFEPEGGAYASGGHGHGQGHGHGAAPGEAEERAHAQAHGHAQGHAHEHEAGHPHDHAHDHAHAPAPAKAAAPAPDHGHRHGPGCGHDHSHGHDHHDH
jgi:urease accessory protein